MADIGTRCLRHRDGRTGSGRRALAGYETALAPVAVRAGSQPGIGWIYAAVAAGVADLLSRAVAGRGAVDVLDKALDPQGGDAQ